MSLISYPFYFKLRLIAICFCLLRIRYDLFISRYARLLRLINCLQTYNIHLHILLLLYFEYLLLFTLLLLLFTRTVLLLLFALFLLLFWLVFIFVLFNDSTFYFFFSKRQTNWQKTIFRNASSLIHSFNQESLAEKTCFHFLYNLIFIFGVGMHVVDLFSLIKVGCLYKLYGTFW